MGKHKYYRKTVGVSRIQTRIVGLEGEHADHLTTTTALPFDFHLKVKLNASNVAFKNMT